MSNNLELDLVNQVLSLVECNARLKALIREYQNEIDHAQCDFGDGIYACSLCMRVKEAIDA